MAQEPPPSQNADTFNDEPQADVATDRPATAAPDKSGAEIAELKTKLARWQADFQNLQRRSAQEIIAERDNANANFAKALLQVLDHFDMALSVDPAKVDAKSILEGVKITYDELKKILANRGIESYDPTGKPFDPHQHEAITQEASNAHPPMTVTQTFQNGYKLGDRVLRPAKVKVSK